MLIRIVRMHFSPDQVDNFVDIFERTKNVIRHAEGCLHLELLCDVGDENCYSTISHWESEQHLDAYRNSELFRNVWTRVKAMFSKRAEVFTLESVSVAV